MESNCATRRSGTYDSDGEREIPPVDCKLDSLAIDTGKVRMARLAQNNASRQLLYVSYVFLMLNFRSDSADNWNSPFQKLLIQKCLIKTDQAGCAVGVLPRPEGS